MPDTVRAVADVRQEPEERMVLSSKMHALAEDTAGACASTIAALVLV